MEAKEVRDHKERKNEIEIYQMGVGTLFMFEYPMPSPKLPSCIHPGDESREGIK